MLALADIRDYISSLAIADQVYIGKLNNKKEHSIGIYHRKEEGPPVTALGGREYSSYDICRISFLVHWDKDVRARSGQLINFMRSYRMYPAWS